MATASSMAVIPTTMANLRLNLHHPGGRHRGMAHLLDGPPHGILQPGNLGCPPLHGLRRPGENRFARESTHPIMDRKTRGRGVERGRGGGKGLSVGVVGDEDDGRRRYWGGDGWKPSPAGGGVGAGASGCGSLRPVAVETAPAFRQEIHIQKALPLSGDCHVRSRDRSRTRFLVPGLGYGFGGAVGS